MGKVFSTLQQMNTARMRTGISLLLFVSIIISVGYYLQRSASAAVSSFGVTVVGSTPENVNTGYKIADATTAPSSGVVNSLSFYIDGKASPSGSGTVTAAIYADAGGTPLAVTPTNLLGASAPRAVPAGQAAG